jgi:hypothetical protein
MIKQVLRNFSSIRSCKIGNSGDSCKLSYDVVTSLKPTEDKVIIVPDFLKDSN